MKRLESFLEAAAVLLAMSAITVLSAADIPRQIDLDHPRVPQFRLSGLDTSDALGRSVDWAGDLNDDGFDDILVGAYRVDGSSGGDVGAGYVVFGGPDRFSSQLDVDALDGSNGFRFLGRSSGDTAGERVAGIGDLNDDGLPDVAIAAYRADPPGTSGAGEVYVVFGSEGAWPASLGPDDFDGDNGFTISGSDSFDQLGRDLDAAGDINDDGIDDLVIGAEGAEAAYVIFGRSTAFPANLNVSDLSGSNGFRLLGEQAGDETGRSVAGLGDFNGDGIGDVAVAAPLAQPGGLSAAGSIYVVFGRNGAFPAQIELGTLSGSDGFRVDSNSSGLELGQAMSAAGDFNDDGFSDLVFSSIKHDEPVFANAGIVFLLFGGSVNGQASFDLSLLDGGNGGRLTGVYSNGDLGRALAPAGDFNQDGIPDWLASADRGDPQGRFDAGEIALVYGTAEGVPVARGVDELDGHQGIVIMGNSPGARAGFDVAGGGDFDADGRVDLLFGAPFADPAGRPDGGQAIVLSGRALEPLFIDRFEMP